MRGLVNDKGDRCATNSVLQCLHATAELRTVLGADSEPGSLATGDRNSVPGELKRVLSDMDSDELQPPYDPKTLVDALRNQYSTSWHEAQYDADDVFRCVRNAMLDDTDPVHKEAANLWVIHKKHYAVCSGCDHCQVSYSTAADVKVYLSGKPPANLQDYVDGYSESFTVHNVCVNCKVPTMLAVTTELTVLPKLLCFNVLRAQRAPEHDNHVPADDGGPSSAVRVVKNTVAFAATEYLDCSRMAEGAPRPNYELYGVIVHRGSELTGHFEAFVKRMSCWYHADDATVELCSASPLTHPDTLSNSYMLMYMQTDLPQRSAL